MDFIHCLNRSNEVLDTNDAAWNCQPSVAGSVDSSSFFVLFSFKAPRQDSPLLALFALEPNQSGVCLQAMLAIEAGDRPDPSMPDSCMKEGWLLEGSVSTPAFSGALQKCMQRPDDSSCGLPRLYGIPHSLLVLLRLC